jgi:hypothetical protein
MIKNILGTILKTALPQLVKIGFDRVQHGGPSEAGPSGNTAGLSALYAGILQKIQSLTAASAALETKLGVLVAAVVLFWGVVVGPADSADHRGWMVTGAVLLGLALLTALVAMMTRALKGSIVDFNDPKYPSYTSYSDDLMLGKLILNGEASARALQKAVQYKASCYRYAVLLFAGGAIAITIGLLRDSM